MHFRRTGAVLRLAILTAVLTWFTQTVAEAANAVTLRDVKEWIVHTKPPSRPTRGLYIFYCRSECKHGCGESD